MLRLPLVGGSDVVIFGKDITVSRSFEKKYPNTDDGFPSTIESVKLHDGHHNNGGWHIKLPFDLVLERVKKHLEEK